MFYKEQLKEILYNLFEILNLSGNNPQAEVIKRLSSAFDQNSSEFYNEINSIDIWGGSGAVWEVGIEDADLSKKFEANMISLIDLMEQHKLINRLSGIKRIRKIFLNNQHDNK